MGSEMAGIAAAAAGGCGIAIREAEAGVREGRKEGGIPIPKEGEDREEKGTVEMGGYLCFYGLVPGNAGYSLATKTSFARIKLFLWQAGPSRRKIFHFPSSGFSFFG
jgi:hypothetical protein